MRLTKPLDVAPAYVYSDRKKLPRGAKERDLVAQVSIRGFVRADPCRQGERRLMAGGMAVAVVRAEISPNGHPDRSER